MAANREHEPRDVKLPDLSNPSERYEHGDVNVMAVTKFGIGLVLLAIFTFLVLVGIFKFFQAREDARQPVRRPGMNVDARRNPPEPRLQQTPILDLQEYNRAEEQILNGYAWVDPAKGIVRIPVASAIDLLAQRGLPSRSAAGKQSAAAGITVPTESGLGPIVQQPGGPLASQLAAAEPAGNSRETAAPPAPAAASAPGSPHRK